MTLLYVMNASAQPVALPALTEAVALVIDAETRIHRKWPNTPTISERGELDYALMRLRHAAEEAGVWGIECRG